MDAQVPLPGRGGGRVSFRTSDAASVVGVQLFPICKAIIKSHEVLVHSEPLKDKSTSAIRPKRRYLSGRDHLEAHRGLFGSRSSKHRPRLQEDELGGKEVRRMQENRAERRRQVVAIKKEARSANSGRSYLLPGLWACRLAV